MIQFKPIKTTDRELYQFMESLIQTAFPKDEYRELDVLRNYTDTKPNFYNNIIVEGDQPIGFITYWNFDNFYYIEHFAIDPNLRNGGYGKKVMESICEMLKSPIVLEVERPDEEMAQRRINFYQRQGFELWHSDYSQPPYREGDSFLPMLLMIHGNLVEDKHYEEVKERIYKEVYNVK